MLKALSKRWRLYTLKRRMRHLTALLENDDYLGVDRFFGGGRPTLDGFHFVRLENIRVSRAKRIESAAFLAARGITMPDGGNPWDMIEDV